MVVSCGGGTVLREENVNLMKAAGKDRPFYVQLETVFDRVKGILAGVKWINLSYIKRADGVNAGPGTQGAADAAVATDGRTAEEICEEILELRNEETRPALFHSGIWNVMVVHEEQSFSGPPESILYPSRS